MPKFRQLVSKRSSRQTPVFQLVPEQPLTAGYFVLQVEPAVRHGLEELDTANPRHAITAVALVSYFMGMGFDYRTARAIVESWETDEGLLRQGVLTE